MTKHISYRRTEYFYKYIDLFAIFTDRVQKIIDKYIIGLVFLWQHGKINSVINSVDQQYRRSSRLILIV